MSLYSIVLNCTTFYKSIGLNYHSHINYLIYQSSQLVHLLNLRWINCVQLTSPTILFDWNQIFLTSNFNDHFVSVESNSFNLKLQWSFCFNGIKSLQTSNFSDNFNILTSNYIDHFFQSNRALCIMIFYFVGGLLGISFLLLPADATTARVVLYILCQVIIDISRFEMKSWFNWTNR